jgi:hypothetical protein
MPVAGDSTRSGFALETGRKLPTLFVLFFPAGVKTRGRCIAHRLLVLRVAVQALNAFRIVRRAHAMADFGTGVSILGQFLI